MGPYGSVGAHIKTGRSPMAQDHFQTPPDPERGYENPKKLKKSLKVRAKPAKFSHQGWIAAGTTPCSWFYMKALQLACPRGAVERAC